MILGPNDPRAVRFPNGRPTKPGPCKVVIDGVEVDAWAGRGGKHLFEDFDAYLEANPELIDEVMGDD